MATFKRPVLQLLILCTLSLLAFPASARPGGRRCNSLFFPDPFIAALIRRADDGSRVFSITSGKILGSDGRLFAWMDFRFPSDISQVRMINLHKQQLENPNLFRGDLDIVMEPRSSPDEQLFFPLMPSRNFDNFPWLNEIPRHSIIRPKPSFHYDHLPEDSWFSNVNDIWRITFGLLLGALCGVAGAAVLTLAWSVFSKICGNSSDEEEIGLLYGYQQLPSPELDEEENLKKASTKETSPKSDNI